MGQRQKADLSVFGHQKFITKRNISVWTLIQYVKIKTLSSEAQLLRKYFLNTGEVPSRFVPHEPYRTSLAGAARVHPCPHTYAINARTTAAQAHFLCGVSSEARCPSVLTVLLKLADRWPPDQFVAHALRTSPVTVRGDCAGDSPVPAQ